MILNNKEYRVVRTQAGSFCVQYRNIKSIFTSKKKWRQAKTTDGRYPDGSPYVISMTYCTLDEAINQLHILAWPSEEDLVVWPVEKK